MKFDKGAPRPAPVLSHLCQHIIFIEKIENASQSVIDVVDRPSAVGQSIIIDTDDVAGAVFDFARQ
jgi:hypothetical protein